jgi:hypothetical protein
VAAEEAQETALRECPGIHDSSDGSEVGCDGENCRKLTSWPDCLASCRPTSHEGLAALRRIVLGLKVLLVLLVCRYFPLMSLQASFFHKVSRQAPTLRICNLALE